MPRGLIDNTGSFDTNGAGAGGAIFDVTIDEFDEAVASGSATYDYTNIHLENTSSLGLKKPIGQITQSMNIILDDISHNDHPHLDTIQFVASKMYNINNMVSRNGIKFMSVSRSLNREQDISMLLKPRFIVGQGFQSDVADTTMKYNFVKGITGSLLGPVAGNVIGNVTGSLSGSVTGNVIGDVQVSNNTQNSQCPIIFTLDTSPDGSVESLKANATVKLNPSLGILYANKVLGESNSHMGSTGSMFITPDKFKPAGTNKLQIQHISGSYTHNAQAGHITTNIQIPKGRLPQKIIVYITNAHPSKIVKLFANRYDADVALIVFEGRSDHMANFGALPIVLSKAQSNTLALQDATGVPHYYTISVGPLQANDKVLGAIISF